MLMFGTNLQTNSVIRQIFWVKDQISRPKKLNHNCRQFLF